MPKARLVLVRAWLVAATSLGLAGTAVAQSPAGEKLRLVVETDLGGDKDDQASLVRLLMYGNDLDLEGIICDRSDAAFGKDAVAANPTGAKSALEMAYDYIDAYGLVHANLIKHSPGYPPPERLKSITVRGHDGTSDGVDLIIGVIDRADPRPVWYGNWGSNSGTTSNLRRALDKVKRTRSLEEYRAFAAKLRIVSLDGPGATRQGHEDVIPLHVETGYPDMDGGRWYHRFASLVGAAADDVQDGHGPLGKLWTGNKEGDTWTFLYLLPSGLHDPEQPWMGSWAGRYGERTGQGRPKNSWHCDGRDTWGGSTSRDNAVKRWKDAPRRDFKARMDWCVATTFAAANHPPSPVVQGDGSGRVLQVQAAVGKPYVLSAAGTTDPDGNGLSYEWTVYREAGTYEGDVVVTGANAERASLMVPGDGLGKTIHVILAVTDDGAVPLTRFRRLIVTGASAMTPGMDGGGSPPDRAAADGGGTVDGPAQGDAAGRDAGAAGEAIGGGGFGGAGGRGGMGGREPVEEPATSPPKGRSRGACAMAAHGPERGSWVWLGILFSFMTLAGRQRRRGAAGPAGSSIPYPDAVERP